MVTYILEFRAPFPLTFRSPSELGVASHGPGVSGKSLEYPFPSTLAGSLAHIGYMSGKRPCGQPGNDGYEDIEACLAEFLGTDSYELYVGFALEEGESRILYYNPTNGFVDAAELETIIEEIAGEREDCKGKERGNRKPRRHTRTGITLHRKQKTVLKEHLYGLEYVETYTEKNQFSYAILLETHSRLAVTKTALKLGGEGRIAFLKSQTINKPITGILVIGDQDCREWILHLLSPALLDKTPWSGSVVLDRKTGKTLATQLIQREGIDAEVIFVQKTLAIGIETIAPGWTSATYHPMPRKPLLHIPPGTLIRIKDTDRETISKIVQEKIGTNGRKIGWGTASAICSKPMKSKTP